MTAHAYFVLFLISFLYLLILVFRFDRKIPIYYTLLSVCILLINYGYWQMSLSATLEEALAATRVSYLGSSFVGYLMVCCIAHVCKTTLPRIIRGVGLALSGTVALLAMTVGHSPIYYQSAQLVQTPGYSYLVKAYGPTHGLFVASVLLSMGCGLFIVIRAFTQKKKVSYISSIASLSILLSVSTVYFIRVSIYALMPVAYDVGFAIVLLLLRRISLYTSTGLSEAAMREGQAYGFVNFDARGRFLDGDAVARQWFPELNELAIDYPVPDDRTEFLRQVRRWITGADDHSPRLFTCGTQIIEARPALLTAGRRRKVCCIQLRRCAAQGHRRQHRPLSP